MKKTKSALFHPWRRKPFLGQSVHKKYFAVMSEWKHHFFAFGVLVVFFSPSGHCVPGWVAMLRFIERNLDLTHSSPVLRGDKSRLKIYFLRTVRHCCSHREFIGVAPPVSLGLPARRSSLPLNLFPFPLDPRCIYIWLSQDTQSFSPNERNGWGLDDACSHCPVIPRRKKTARSSPKPFVPATIAGEKFQREK